MGFECAAFWGLDTEQLSPLWPPSPHASEECCCQRESGSSPLSCLPRGIRGASCTNVLLQYWKQPLLVLEAFVVEDSIGSKEFWRTGKRVILNLATEIENWPNPPQVVQLVDGTWEEAKSQKTFFYFCLNFWSLSFVT